MSNPEYNQLLDPGNLCVLGIMTSVLLYMVARKLHPKKRAYTPRQMRIRAMLTILNESRQDSDVNSPHIELIPDSSKRLSSGEKIKLLKPPNKEE